MDIKAIGNRVQEARLAAGLSQAQIAEELGIPRPAVSLIESGQRSVSSVELAKLSRLLGRPVTSFLKQEDERVARLFRAETLSEADLESVNSSFEECRYYAFLEKAVDRRHNEIPAYPVPKGPAIQQGADLAEQERRRLGLANAPIPSMIRLLEQEGVKVVLQRFPEPTQLSGCYLFSEDVGPCVIINEKDVPSRRRFTTAHEYAHFLVDRGDKSADACLYERHREVAEMRANAFAANFLLPAAGMEEFLCGLGIERGGVRGEHVVHVTYAFGVSYEAALWRLVNLNWISKDERAQLAQVPPTRLREVLGYNGEPGDSEAKPQRFHDIAIEAWRRDEISLGKLAEILKVPKGELRQVLTREEGTASPRRVRVASTEPDWF